MIENVRNRYSRTRVTIDGQRFDGCFFDNCAIVFSGTGSYHFVNCTFNDCSFAFEGPAAAAVRFMTDFYKIAPQMIEATFDKIRLGG